MAAYRLAPFPIHSPGSLGGRNEFIISSLDNPCAKPSGPSRGLSCPTAPGSLPVILNILPVILSEAKNLNAKNLSPSVVLKPAFGVLKMTLTLPSSVTAGSKVYGVRVTATGGSLFRVNDGYAVIGNLAYGSWTDNGIIALNGSEGIAVPADRKLVCYMPILPRSSFGVGSITSIKVRVAKIYSSGIFWSGTYTATKTLTADPAIPAEAGKMYRMELSFE